MNTVNDIATLTNLPTKPKTSAYGYVAENQVSYPCSREELIAKIGDLNFLQTNAVLVWTPEVETFVEPYKIPYLFAPFKQRLRNLAILKLIGSVAVLAGCWWLMQRFPSGLLLLPLLFIIIPGFLYLWDGMRTILWLKNLKLEALLQPEAPQFTPEEIERIRHVQTIRLTWTKEIMACLMTVGALQLFAPDSGIYTAGLVKPAVWQGEVWRLLTAGMLHGGLFHFWMNFGSLTWLGRMTEAFTHRAYLPIVFMLSIVSGCLFSMWLSPNTTSVGASGGLMGLIGFLVIVGWRHKSVMPSNFFQNLLVNLGMIAVVGFIGRNFIDNAGHLGGFVAGAALGFGLIPARQYEPIAMIQKLSQFFRALVPLTAATTCLLMFRHDLVWGGILMLLVGSAAFWAVRKFSYFDQY